MDRLSIKAEERSILGKKVKTLRRDGKLPAHVFGNKTDGENIAVDGKGFLKAFQQAGESGLIDLKIGAEKVRPVLVRGVQYDPLSGNPIHVDFYQVNLLEKVTVPVSFEIVGEEPEKVHLGEAIVLQTMDQVDVEALPTDLVDKIEVNISHLKEIDDAITIGQLNYDREKLTISSDPDQVVVKLAPAVSAEMEELMAEQEAELEAKQTEGEEGESLTPNEQEAEAEEQGSEGAGNDAGNSGNTD